MPKTTVLHAPLRQEIHDHPHGDKIKNILDKVSKSVLDVFSPNKRIDTDKTINIIDPEHKKIIKNSSQSDNIKTFINEITPKIIKSLDKVQDQGNVTKNTIDSSISGIASPTMQDSPIPNNASNHQLPAPVIAQDIREEIIQHPNKNTLIDLLNKLANKVLPIVENAVKTGEKIAAEKVAEEVRKLDSGEAGNQLAGIVSDTIHKTGDDVITTLENTKDNMSLALIDPDLKEKIANHRFGDTIKEFLHKTLPGILETLETIAVVAGKVATTVASNALKGIKLPGELNLVLSDALLLIGKNLTLPNANKLMIEAKKEATEKDKTSTDVPAVSSAVPTEQSKSEETSKNNDIEHVLSNLSLVEAPKSDSPAVEESSSHNPITPNSSTMLVEPQINYDTTHTGNVTPNNIGISSNATDNTMIADTTPLLAEINEATVVGDLHDSNVNVA